ncbi:14087_t:CDS:2 [Cetraspora pellucida]|uniref:14087_t:CDS:1 n=1 Tax=Cetraspora pellucida TaxID=1433469 RepID=A0A9N9FZT2_9GLOM|nr:14087_t:CDS:2 [Cetraspora pellucida]
MTESIMTDILDFDVELKPLSFDNISFNKAYEFAEAEEEEDINILRENNDTNIDINSNNIAALDSEFELNDKNKYLIQDTINHVNLNDSHEINQLLFGTSVFTNNLLEVYETTFQNFLLLDTKNWDVNSILNKIVKNVPIGCQVPSFKVVILSLKENLNCDKNIIANMASKLGVQFLDKLKSVIDYLATCKVLELIWIAISITICKYLRYDYFYKKKSHNIKKRSFIEFANKLFIALTLPDAKTYEIFMYISEMTPVEFSDIFTCYDLGIACLKEILQQDVYKIEPRNTKGYKKCNVVMHNNDTTDKLYEQTDVKHQHRVTNNNEKILLEELLKFDIFPEDKAIEMLEKI